MAITTTIRVRRMDDFILRAIFGTALLAAAAGPIGCFVLWRRMAYLGESIAHLGLLGAALGLLIGIAPLWGVTAVAIVAALLLSRAGDRLIPSGTVIGILGHVGLALGFVVLSSMEEVRADLMGYLFGDVLALSNEDVLLLAASGAGLLALTALLWRPLLAATLNTDIARAEGHYKKFAEVGYLVLIALLVAIGLKVVGALLIVALVIIPPAAARPLARTPVLMAVIAAILGALSAPLGLVAADLTDAPAGPAIVLAAAALFIVTNSITRICELLGRRQQGTL